jgi:hypothetical protein
VSWRVLTDTAWSDLEGLTAEERSSIASDLMAWTEHGPPRGNRREVGGALLFTDDLPSGFRVVYVVDESVPYAAVVRIRRRPSEG